MNDTEIFPEGFEVFTSRLPPPPKQTLCRRRMLLCACSVVFPRANTPSFLLFMHIERSKAAFAFLSPRFATPSKIFEAARLSTSKRVKCAVNETASERGTIRVHSASSSSMIFDEFLSSAISRNKQTPNSF